MEVRKMDNNEITGYVGSGFIAVLGALQLDEALKWGNLILAILTAIVTLCFTTWKWYKLAKADGKITIDELGDLANQVKDSASKISEDVNKLKEEKKNEGNTGAQ